MQFSLEFVAYCVMLIVKVELQLIYSCFHASILQNVCNFSASSPLLWLCLRGERSRCVAFMKAGNSVAFLLGEKYFAGADGTRGHYGVIDFKMHN
jgi:hypothetical protein